MNTDWSDLVVCEVEELLTVGRVGVYEFFEILRSQPSPPPATEWTQISTQALNQLLRRSSLGLFWLKWASDFREPADGAIPTAADWQTPTEKPYLALDMV